MVLSTGRKEHRIQNHRDAQRSGSSSLPVPEPREKGKSRKKNLERELKTSMYVCSQKMSSVLVGSSASASKIRLPLLFQRDFHLIMLGLHFLMLLTYFISVSHSLRLCRAIRHNKNFVPPPPLQSSFVFLVFNQPLQS